MPSVTQLTHKGKKIIVIDVSRCKPAETLTILPQARRLIDACAPGSALILTNVADAVYDKAVSEALKAFSKANLPYTRASAVIGADGVRGVLLTTINLLLRRQIRTFDTQQQALDWLAAQN